MELVAHLSESFTSEQRGAPRRTLRLHAENGSAESSSSPLLIHDLSATGLLVQTDDPPAIGEKLHIVLLEQGRFPAKVVWSSGRFVGCRFDRPLPRAALSAALLRGVLPGAERPADPAGASSPALALQERVKKLVHGPAEITAVEVAFEQQTYHSGDRLPLHVRGRILVGLGAASAGTWLLILWVAGLI